MEILVVDDAPEIRIVVKKYLENLQHKVTLAEDGDVAWGLLQAHDFDIVLSDWIMPNRDGLALCRDIRAESLDRYLYVILLTGLSEKKDLIKGLDAGADDFITKPIHFEELEVRLNAAQRIIDSEKILKQKNDELDEAHGSLQTMHDSILRDLKRAAMVQKSLLPKKMSNEKIAINWFYRPSTLIGGDSFDYFSIEDRFG